MKIAPFPGTLEKSPVPSGRGLGGTVLKYFLTDEQQAWLCKWFPELGNSKLMKVSGMKFSTLHRFANSLGLTKSKKGLKRIRKKGAARAKRTCEKNGYYASIRGKQPSDACVQASRKMWQEISEGKREHPFQVMKRTDKRKYRKWIENKRKERTELIRRERQRMLYGLDRKTKLKIVVMNKYTRKQVAHRYNALRRGYFVMDDCSEEGGERYNIYYDGETRRGEIFEQNLMEDGFVVKEWKE